jgi:hypothetical protein
VLLRPLTPSRIRARIAVVAATVVPTEAALFSPAAASANALSLIVLFAAVYPDRRRGRNGGRAPDRTRTATDIAGLLL